MKIYILLSLCLCLLLSGCTPNSLHATVPPIASTETVTHQSTAPDGNLLLERSYPRFTLTFPDARISQSIAKDLQRRIDGWMAVSADLESFALKEYQPEKDWPLWYARLESQIMRLDATLFSVYFTYSEFTGGNHPALTTHSVTYDSQTGQILTLADLVEEGLPLTILSSYVNAALKPQSQALYDDYEALVGKAFCDGIDQWYLSADGLCFHFAPYAIAPYSAGVITATVPYDQLNQIIRSPYLHK